MHIGRRQEQEEQFLQQNPCFGEMPEQVLFSWRLLKSSKAWLHRVHSDFCCCRAI